jgi:beta-lactamase class A
MTIGALAEASVTVSDNTAANLLLARIGGPQGLTEFARSCGDSVTRLDRNEPTLNTNDPGDPRDTTSPRAMVGLMGRVLCEDVLPEPSRELLVSWMRASETGKERLRAGFPSDWEAGDKTGTGGRNSVNDVAIAWPPGRAPILVAVYTSASGAEMSALQAAHAEVGRLVGSEWS